MDDLTEEPMKKNGVDKRESSHSRSIVVEVNEKSREECSNDDEDDEENTLTEESPDGRWQRRDRKVFENDLSGCDCCCSYLAIDSDEGVEVVWNEVLIPVGDHNKSVDAEAQIQDLFKRLIEIDHPNIVKLHAYWTCLRTHHQHRVVSMSGQCEDLVLRAVFITEHVDTGSLRQFLRNTRKTNVRISKACWRRWCIQILGALHYLHSSHPAVVHGMLSSQTVFIQSDGVLKVAVVSPRLVHLHMSGQCNRRPARDALYRAPEYFRKDQDKNANNSIIGTPADIFAFGIVAIEMLTCDMSTLNAQSGEKNCHHPPNNAFSIFEAVDFNDDFDPVEQSCVQHFISLCLEEECLNRANALCLLQHPAVFETYSLKLLSAHSTIQFFNEQQHYKTYRSSDQRIIVDKKRESEKKTLSDNLANSDSFQAILMSVDTRVTESITCLYGRADNNDKEAEKSADDLNQKRTFTSKELSQYAGTCDLNDFLEDVRNGQYAPTLPIVTRSNHDYSTCTHEHHHSESGWVKEERGISSLRSQSYESGLHSPIDTQQYDLIHVGPSLQVPSVKSCSVANVFEDETLISVHLVFEEEKHEDGGNNDGIRQVTVLVRKGSNITNELIRRGIVRPDDANFINQHLRNINNGIHTPFEHSNNHF